MSHPNVSPIRHYELVRELYETDSVSTAACAIAQQQHREIPLADQLNEMYFAAVRLDCLQVADLLLELANDEDTLIKMPAGIRHHDTLGFAPRALYDQLPADEWNEVVWWIDIHGAPVPEGTVGADERRKKKTVLRNGADLTVMPDPTERRREREELVGAGETESS